MPAPQQSPQPSQLKRGCLQVFFVGGGILFALFIVAIIASHRSPSSPTAQKVEPSGPPSEEERQAFERNARLDKLFNAPLPPGMSERFSTSPYATAADFAKYAMKIREQGLLKVEPQVFAPTSSQPTTQRFPWKTNIVTTVFWVGERQGAGKMSGEHESVWDKDWQKNYGGVDEPEPSARRDYIPVSFVPQQNPFYCALPYNDVTHGGFKPEVPLIIPWFKQAYTGPGQSVCKDRWVAIRKGNRICYAQWEDCGPFLTDHFQYVFGNERPKPNSNHGAGLSVSPAVRDYLGLAATDVTDWQFVEVRDVPPGPWPGLR